MSKALLKSNETSLVKPLLSMNSFHFPRVNIGAVCVFYSFLYPYNWGDKSCQCILKSASA